MGYAFTLPMSCSLVQDFFFFKDNKANKTKPPKTS